MLSFFLKVVSGRTADHGTFVKGVSGRTADHTFLSLPNFDFVEIESSLGND